MHTCPESDGPVPHVGGPILTGSPNVFIGGLPAARVTDKVTCVGPPDMIVMGSPTVLINGLPAARMGDQTAHGGVIVGGLGTVLIGTAAGPAPPPSARRRPASAYGTATLISAPMTRLPIWSGSIPMQR